jgi:iron complex transport system substrate-binding protein
MTRPLLLGALLLAGCPRAPEEAAPTKRIASVTIDSDATLWALGPPVREHVIAVSSLVDDARYSPLVDTWPSSVPRVSGSSESLIALRPSVVFVAEWSDPNGRAMLERSDAQVVVLSGYGGFDDYRQRVRTIAAAVGAEDAGGRLIGEFDHALAIARSGAGKGLKVVSYSAGNVAAAGTTFADEAQAAGFVNLPSAQGLQGHAAVSLEQLVAWMPDAIVIPCEDDCKATERTFAGKPGVAATPAAKSDRIIAIEAPLLFATGPRMVQVVEAHNTRMGAPTP